MGAVELTLVCENTAARAGVLGEHGLCWRLRTDDGTLLFDTGQGLALPRNCEALGVDLPALDAVVLSHGHYDHVLGLAHVLAHNAHCPVHAHPAALEEKFSRQPNGACKPLSIPLLTDAATRRTWDARLRLSDRPVELLPGLFTTGQVPRTTTFEDVGGPFYLDAALTRPDPLDDDMSLYFPTSEGTCVVLGCAHAGVINILRHVRSLTGNRPIAAVYGGMHLLVATPERLARTVEALRELGSPRLHPNHCTGYHAVHHLHAAFPGNVLPAAVGMSWRFAV